MNGEYISNPSTMGDLVNLFHIMKWWITPAIGDTYFTSHVHCTLNLARQLHIIVCMKPCALLETVSDTQSPGEHQSWFLPLCVPCLAILYVNKIEVRVSSGNYPIKWALIVHIRGNGGDIMAISNAVTSPIYNDCYKGFYTNGVMRAAAGVTIARNVG